MLFVLWLSEQGISLLPQEKSLRSVRGLLRELDHVHGEAIEISPAEDERMIFLM